MRIDEKFQKAVRPEKVIQFGEGGFLRGFVDWMLQKLNDSGAWNGSVLASKRGLFWVWPASVCAVSASAAGAVLLAGAVSLEQAERVSAMAMAPASRVLDEIMESARMEWMEWAAQRPWRRARRGWKSRPRADAAGRKRPIIPHVIPHAGPSMPEGASAAMCQQSPPAVRRAGRVSPCGRPHPR